MRIEDAIACLKANGYTVRKARTSRRKKDRVGPTFVARFADGQVTRMSCHCESDEKLDWTRGQILAQAAWQSRARANISSELRDAVWRMQHDSIMDKNRLAGFCHRRVNNPIPPRITDSWFERDGVQL